MIKGLYAAASAMLVGMERQKTISHNLANLDTPGFKQIFSGQDDFLRAAAVQPHPTASFNQQLILVGDVGLGVENAEAYIDYSAGSMKFTGQPLDLAIHGEGFFRVQTPEGEQYTRDGRFILDSQRRLVTVDGYFVLDADGEPIELPSGTTAVMGDGSVIVEDELVAQIDLAVFANPEQDLQKGLPNCFTAVGQPVDEPAGSIEQGFLEMSNTNSAEMMTQMVMVSRSYEAAQRMVQVQDELLGQAINSLGRI